MALMFGSGRLKCKRNLPGAFGTALGTVILDGYRDGLHGIDWYKVVIVALVTLVILSVMSLLSRPDDRQT